jgi:WD40 repeat protein
MPRRAPLPIAALIAVGVANPTAHGHATSSIVIARRRSRVTSKVSADSANEAGTAQYLYDSFTSVDFSPDGTTFIANKAGDGATLHRLKDGQPLAHIDNAVNWRFQDTGDLVAIVTNQADIELLSSSTGRKVASLTGHTGFVAGVWFSPQGDALASAASDGTVSVWQIRGSYPAPDR